MLKSKIQELEITVNNQTGEEQMLKSKIEELEITINNQISEITKCSNENSELTC